MPAKAPLKSEPRKTGDRSTDTVPPKKNPEATGAAARHLYQSRRPRKSIKLDRVDPRDYARLQMIFACEDCSHYDSEGASCTIGYRAQHRREEQMALYNLTGKMAFCRFLEID